jgi:hypothetical protein
VADLQEISRRWNKQKLIALFMQQQTQQITLTIVTPNQRDLRTDRLIWKLSMKGVYTVKEGYKLLTKRRGTKNSMITDIAKII